MRTRLLVSVAALAAALLPASAHAATIAVASAQYATPVQLTWDVTGTLSQDVYRAPGACAALPMTGAVSIVSETPPVSTALAAGTTTYDDTPPANGTYCYYVEAVDLDTTVADSAGVVVHLDSVAPSSTLTAPLGGPLRATVAAHATASDEVGGTGVGTVAFQGSPAGAGTWTTFATGSLSAGVYDGSLDTTTLAGDGLYDVRTLVTDLAGNIAASPTVASLLVDNTAPSPAVTSPTASAKLHGAIISTATATDGGSGIAMVAFQTAPAGTSTWTTYATDPSPPFQGTLDTATLGGDGLYDVRVLATDVAGNSAAATVTNVRVDNTAPSGSLTGPVSGASVRATIIADATAIDPGGSGVATVAFQSSPAGAGTWTTYDSDAAAPYHGTLNTTTLAGDGLYDLRVLVTDAAGNGAPSAPVVNVRVDNTAPSGALTAPVAAATVSGTIIADANAVDGGSGVATVAFQSSPAGAATWTTYASDAAAPYHGTLNTTTLAGDGLYDLRVLVTDAAGNTGTSSTVAGVLVDNHAPPTPARPTGFPSVQSSPTITFASVTDGISGGVRSGVDHYDVYRDGAPVHTVFVADPSAQPATYTWADASAASGSPAPSYTYTVRAVDAAGNASSFSSGLSILVDAAAASAPTSVVAQKTPTNLLPQLTWMAPGGGAGFIVHHYKVYRDNTFVLDVPTPVFAESAGLPDGTYTYQVVAASAGDATLGIASAGVTVTYDTAPPSAPDGPSASAALDGSIAVAWGASGDAGSGVARYAVRRAQSSVAPATIADGDAVCQGLTTSCIDTTALNGKLYSYAVFAVDAAGNTSAAGTAPAVTARDQLAPAVPSGLAAAPGDTTVALQWAAAGANDDVAGYVLVVKPGGTAPASDSDGTRVCSTLVASSTACTATGLTNGAAYTFGLFALDEALNRSAAATVTTAPNGPVTDTVAPGAVTKLDAKVSGHTVTLTWKNPADKDFDHVEINASERRPAAHKAVKRVYSGKGSKATITLPQGQSRWFTVVAYDRVGNASAPAAVHVAIAPASPFGPAPRARVHGRVQLRWPVIKGAAYYNVQLYAGKRRILVSWPAGHAVRLPKAKLKRGTKYTWYVWPGLGAKSKARYGKLIGKNVFTYAG